MAFDLTDNVHVNRNARGNVQHLEHFQQPFVAAGTEAVAALALDADAPVAAASTPQGLAEQYLREVAPIYGIEESLLPGQDGASLAADGAAGGKLELTEEKAVMGTTTVSYQQTYNGLPVWEAGVNLTVQPEPMRVTSSQSSVHPDVDLPPDDALGATAFNPETITPEVLEMLLGIIEEVKPVLNGTRRLIYQYDPDRRFDPETRQYEAEAFQEGPPILPLPPVPDSIQPGQHYTVTEVLFTLPLEGYGPVNWRAFVEESTGAVLYLRAFIACAAGMIFRTDPATAGAGAGVTPTAGAAALNPFRSALPLDGLASGNPQALSGGFVRLVDNQAPAIAPPTQANPPANFFFDAPTREFAAVNAYHHCDWLFRHMQGMGFNIASYFDGTTFPVPVDACAFTDALNARAPGNVTGVGSGGFQFGLAGTPFPAVSIAADVRVVLHEFGHALLWDSVHSPNFGFAHSAGDSLAAILMDPESALRTDPVRRFLTFPWIPIGRNHGREVAAGWGWDGVNDVGGYSSEQILSTTLFRLYRSLGGDSADVSRRKMAARQAVYLVFRAIGSLASAPVTPTPNPDVFATALMNADIGTSDFEGHRGGAFHKVIRWSFEKQGLYQAPGSPLPVTTAGAPPDVDVYIDDGRHGEYPYQPVHWECTDIWNRLKASAGGGGGAHQTPVVGVRNFAYVRVKNRGTQHANNVVVRGYSANPGAGLAWPADWAPMDTPQIAVPGGIPSGGSVVVGPFRWTPHVAGHECMFMEVSASGDRSNIDAATFFPCAAGPTPEWRLVPFDNNLGQRNVVPVPAGGGLRGLLSGFLNRRFLVRNPLDRQTRMEVKIELPPLLAERGWRGILDRREGATTLSLAPGASKEVTISLLPGRAFDLRDLLRFKEGAAIRVVVFAEGTVIGGMTYRLNPNLKQAPVERQGDRPISLDDPAIDALIREAQLREEEAEMPLVADADGLEDVLEDAGEDDLEGA
ncbi:MAG TPA: hypothetical protein VKK31_20500 [Thermoanaerobaculia bacterium]|nr:hypothetical protein [Thermoanaerobaculia bacterium]